MLFPSPAAAGADIGALGFSAIPVCHFKWILGQCFLLRVATRGRILTNQKLGRSPCKVKWEEGVLHRSFRISCEKFIYMPIDIWRMLSE
jgi:hypothetical protein